jgi:UDP-N-acetylglucosamine 2-epimerase
MTKRIYNVGSPGLDYITRSKLLSKQELQQRVLIDLNQPFIVACFHPETKNLEQTNKCVNNFMQVLISIPEQALIISPNIDPSNELIRKIYDAYKKKMICILLTTLTT